MLGRVQALLNDLTAQFEAGNLSGVITHYDFPLHLDLEDRSVLLTGPAEMEALLQHVMQTYHEKAWTRTVAQITALELPRRGRMRAWVRYHHSDSTGKVMQHSDRIFHLRDRGNRFVIDALEITRLATSEFRIWHPPRRRSA